MNSGFGGVHSARNRIVFAEKLHPNIAISSSTTRKDAIKKKSSRKIKSKPRNRKPKKKTRQVLAAPKPPQQITLRSEEKGVNQTFPEEEKEGENPGFSFLKVI